MLLWMNSIVEGQLMRSVAAPESIARASLMSVLRLQRSAGKRVETREEGGRVRHEAWHGDERVHAIYWLSAHNQGSTASH